MSPTRVDLAELEAQEVDLPFAGSGVATQRRRAASASRTAARAASRSAQVDGRVAIEGAALAGGGEQPDVGVLPVQVDQRGGQLGELPGRDEAPVPVGARLARGGARPG